MDVLQARDQAMTSISWRALRRAAFVSALNVLAAGCAHPKMSNTKDVVELRVFDRITTVMGAEYSQWLVASFNSQNRGKIHVTWSGTEDEMFKPKINLVLRSPSAPDVFFTWEGGWAQYMVDSGYAEPLDRYYEKYGWDHELNRAGTSLAWLESHRYFVPTKMAASLVWYRPDLFEQCGLSVPRSWSEMLVAARQLKAKGIVPFLMANQKRWPAQFMWSALFVNKYGLETYNRLLTRKVPWTDPRVVDIFALMKSLSDEGLFEEESNALDVTPAATLFASGRAGMWYQGSFLLTRFLDDKGLPLFPFAFFEFPPVDAAPSTVSVFVEDGLMINRHSVHPDEAAAFLDWVLSTEAQERQLQVGLPYPANVNVDLTKLPAVPQELGRLIASHSTTTFMHIDHALSPAISNPFLDFLQAVLVGAMSPQAAAKQTEEVAEGVDVTSWRHRYERGVEPVEVGFQEFPQTDRH
jgi:raffinose/stachyose/melibiose transport system substrate-binding protein